MKKLIFFLTLLLSLSFNSFTQTIKSYHSFFAEATIRNQETHLLIIRKYIQNSNTLYIAVNPNTLIVDIFPEQKLLIKKDSIKSILSVFPKSAYSKAWKMAKRNEKPLQDAGVSHALPDKQGVILTIDLCPTEKPLDRSLFLDLLNQLGGFQQPIPITISVSGRWMLKHPEDLDWLKKLDLQNKVSILWVNHSFHHFYNKELPLYLNFMLWKKTNVEEEILLNEITMLENGIMPSVFFRFPGLVSEPKVFEKVMSYGLIPIGSDAWLAKGEHAKNGNIVLVHANGNEPLGVQKFIELLHHNEKEIQKGDWKLFDLRESVIKEAESHYAD
jgi:hypothetical protein